MAFKDFLIHLPTTVVFPSLKTPSLFSPNMLEAKIKQLKKKGLQNTNHKPAIELEDLEKLKTVKFFHLPSPGPF